MTATCETRGVVTVLVADRPLPDVELARFGGRPAGVPHAAVFVTAGAADACARALAVAGGAFALETGEQSSTATMAALVDGAGRRLARGGQIQYGNATALLLAHRRPQPAGLPRARGRFVGRRDELARLAEWVAAGARLITITGTAGTGKTRLAAEHLRSAAEPVVWVELQALSEAAQLPEAILRALGGGSSGGEPLAAAIERLADGPRRLVFDNFEHLGDEAAETVWQLLEQLPELCCLVTSRRRLGYGGEQELLLAPLPVPETADPDSLARNESVQLMADRARAAGAPLELEADAAALAGLCRRLEGIPLALELAAARLAELPAAELLAGLESGLSALCDEQPETEPRHRTLLAAVEWSYRLLPPEVQRFFAGLAVFRGSFGLAAAEAVSAEPFALDYLAELRDHSLLVVDGAGAEVRYRLLETLREYAAARLAERDDEGLHRRHYEHYRALADEAARRLEHEGEADATLLALDRDDDNLRAALAWAQQADRERALALAGSLWRYWLVRGRWIEASAAFEAGLAAEHELPEALRAKALGWAGHLALRQGDYPVAERRLAAALELSAALGDRRGAAHALNELGKVDWSRGEYVAARNFLEASLAIRRELADRWGIAASLSNLASVAAAMGERDQAAGYLTESLALRRELGDRRGTAGSLNSLGAIAYLRGDYAGARELLDESYAIRRQLDDRPGMAAALNDLGAVAQARGESAEARQCYGRSLAIRRDINDQRGVAVTLNNLGVVARETGDYAAAEACYRESLAVHRAIGNRQGEALTLSNLGDLAAARGDYLPAREQYLRAQTIQRAIGDARGQATAHLNFGDLAREQGEAETACEHYHGALALAHQTEDRNIGAGALRGLGELALAAGQTGDARRLAVGALAVRQAMDDLPGAVACLELLARTDAGEESAAWLGAAEAQREALPLPRTAFDQALADAHLTLLAERLGRDELERCLAAGRSRDWRAVVAEAAASVAG